jgi:hypothetical protein
VDGKTYEVGEEKGEKEMDGEIIVNDSDYFIDGSPSQPEHMINAGRSLQPLCQIHDSPVSDLILAFAASKDTRIRSQ